MKYSKPPLSYSDQIKHLETRGLVIPNIKDAEYFLAKVSYYRLSAYYMPFETQKHQFKSDVRFEDITSLYRFDRHLRQLLDNALEVIEIYFRAKIAYTLTVNHHAFIHEDPKNFRDKNRHKQ